MIEANSLKRGVKPGVYLQVYYLFCCYLVAKSHPTICDPTDCGLPDSSVYGILQARYWSGLPFPSPGDLPNPGIEPGSPALQADSLPTEL